MVCLILGTVGCVEDEKESEFLDEFKKKQFEIPESEQSADLSKLVFKHPLQGVKLIDGKVPGVDIQDSPSGRRYIVGERTSQPLENGPVINESGVFEIEQGPLDRSSKTRNSDNSFLYSKLPKPNIPQ